MSRRGTTGDIEMNRTLFLVLLLAAVELLFIWLVFNFVVWRDYTGWGMLIFSGILFISFLWTVLKKG